jgi:GNAT superfamily N-acetyltransferase
MPAVIRPYGDSDLDVVRTLFIRVNRELAPRLAASFEDYIARCLAEEIERIPAYYRERHGSFWVATDGSGSIGMFGLERVDATSAELRRMYVDPCARRGGFARRMLAFAEDLARREQCTVMMLSTSELQSAAISLYRNSAYRLVREAVAAETSNKTVGYSSFLFCEELVTLARCFDHSSPIASQRIGLYSGSAGSHLLRRNRDRRGFGSLLKSGAVKHDDRRSR